MWVGSDLAGPTLLFRRTRPPPEFTNLQDLFPCTEQVPVSAYVVSSMNLKDLKDTLLDNLRVSPCTLHIAVHTEMLPGGCTVQTNVVD